MKYKFKPVMLGAAITLIAFLSSCDSTQPQPEIVDVFAETGLWCKSPEIVQIASADSYALSTVEQDALDAAKAAAKLDAEAAAGASWNEAEWEADFKYQDLDLYSLLGLTLEELERQAIAREEARAFQVSQGQDTIRGEGFDAWLITWFDAIAPEVYLGPSQRINRAVNATTPDMDGEEICYTPPLSCPNYKVIDESGTYECIVPEQNLIADAPAPIYTAMAGEAVAYYRHEDHDDAGDNIALYENMVVHLWNNDDCTTYADDTTSPEWGITGGVGGDIDPNYGRYWILNLVEGHSNCGNIIFNDTQGSKKISDSDLIMPLGEAGDVTLHNLDKMAYAHDDFPVNVLDGLLIINQHPYFGAEASSGLKSCGWSQEADDSGELCLGQALECPAGSVAVGVGTVDIASKCVTIFDPEVTDLLLRGGFNGWGSSDDPNFDASQLVYEGNGQYRVNYTYTTDCVIVPAVDPDPGEDCVSNYDFKVADLGWSESATFGSIKGGDQSAVGSTILMTVGSVSQNMKVEMAKDKIYQFLVDAGDATAVELTINEVPVDAFPLIMIDATSSEFSYRSNGVYFSEQALSGGTTYSVAVSDFGLSFGAPVDNVLPGDTVIDLAADGGAFSFTAGNDGNYIFILDLSNLAAPTFKVETPTPFGADKLFIRGTVTGWGDPAPDADEMVWNLGARTYSVIYGLEQGGDHNFKFASQAWGGPLDLGGSFFTFSPDGEALAGDGNITVSVAKSTSYKFSISYATADPVLKVEEAPLYLRGGVTASGWGADANNQLGFIGTDPGYDAEASHTYSLVVDYAGGAAAFKVADEGWGGNFGYNYGVPVENTAVELGVPLTLSTEDGSNFNILIDVPAGTYVFDFEDGVTKTITVTAQP